MNYCEYGGHKMDNNHYGYVTREGSRYLTKCCMICMTPLLEKIREKKYATNN